SAATLVRLHLTHVLPQRLRRQPEIGRHVRDRPARLEHQPRRALQQLHRVLPRSWHDRTLLPPGGPWQRSLRQTRDGSGIQCVHYLTSSTADESCLTEGGKPHIARGNPSRERLVTVTRTKAPRLS